MISNLGILVSTHVGHKRFHKPVLSCLRNINPKKLICSYNTNNGYLGWPTLTPILPDNDTMELADKWILHSVDRAGSSWGELHLAGISLLANYDIDFVYATEGDCYITKPEGLDILRDRLINEHGDIICADKFGEKGAATISYFARTEVVVELMKSYMSHQQDTELLGCAPEGHWGAAIYRLQVKCLSVRNPEHSQFSYGDRGEWGDTLGFIHLHGSEKWRIGNHHHPLPKSFYDIRHLPQRELIALEKYWATGNIEHLITDAYWSPVKCVNNQKELLDI